jgi:hypothetical protein
MKKSNLEKFERLDRSMMKEIIAGTFGNIDELYIICSDGTSYPVDNCEEESSLMVCRNHGGAKICAGRSVDAPSLTN